jgi:uncharacterized protein YyaL (SSP411 family)
MDSPDTNRLIHEMSPYLLQHAHNPVDWHPWSEEAFRRAKAEDKPIFLSIGYSTCHWCHVMAHESFEDEGIARLLNETFICIKVDREERPDIDQIYMKVSFALTGKGGWPLTIVMTPEKMPFFAASYIPKESRFNLTGLKDLIPAIRDAWTNRRDELNNSAENIVDIIQKKSDLKGGTIPENILDICFQSLQHTYDSVYGGFGTGPKFPASHTLMFLLRYSLRTKSALPLQMVTNTLQAMRDGGVYDHIGFGFHRYATDREWIVPHFEKMLYDQALNTIAYIEAFQYTGREEFRATAVEIFTYVLRDMQSGEGGFFSAEDADSEGIEGKFYTWTMDELETLLGSEEASLFAAAYQVTSEGNFSHDAAGAEGGENILYRIPKRGTPANPSHQERLERARVRLLSARNERIRPEKDDKILTDWNGLMIAALALGGRALGEERYIDAAKDAAKFIRENLFDGNGRLLHQYRKGEAGVFALLEDYAFLIWGLIELYESTFEVHYLTEAIDLNSRLMDHFWDTVQGGLYRTADNGEDLILRVKEAYDGAIPSGNSIAMLNLLRLSRLTGTIEYEEKAQAIAAAFAREIARTPAGSTLLCCALDFALGPTEEVIIVGSGEDTLTAHMVERMHAAFLPRAVFHLITGENRGELSRIAPYTQMIAGGETAIAYVCRDFACSLPTDDPDIMAEQAGIRGPH